MPWNWQAPDWPEWRYDSDALAGHERRFLLQAGQLIGAWSHLAQDDRDDTVVEIFTAEAMKTSEIEGEYLDRESVRSSLRCAFGLGAGGRQGAAESGIADLLTDGFRNWRAPLDRDTLFRWHGMVCRGRTDLRDPGRWRRGPEAMQVVSGPVGRPTVHFEAPPADRVPAEMDRFISWFNATEPGGPSPLPALARAGLAHLDFVSVHPFEDGNGRIARVLSDKALAQGMTQPSLTALSVRIEETGKAYYRQLAAASTTMEVTGWLVWFADAVLGAQASARGLIGHLIFRTRLLEHIRDRINDRQTRALLRMFKAGPGGFKGGLSAANYMRITAASPATARRDLVELVALGALRRTGERKGTRYFLQDPGSGPPDS